MPSETTTGQAPAAQAPAPQSGQPQAAPATAPPAEVSAPAGAPQMDLPTLQRSYDELRSKFNERDQEVVDLRALAEFVNSNPQASAALRRHLGYEEPAAAAAAPATAQPTNGEDEALTELRQATNQLLSDPDAAADSIAKAVSELADRRAKTLVSEATQPMQRERLAQEWAAIIKYSNEKAGIDLQSRPNQARLAQTFQMMRTEQGKDPRPGDVFFRAFGAELIDAAKAKAIQEEQERIRGLKVAGTEMPRSAQSAGPMPRRLSTRERLTLAKKEMGIA